jgi:hypothetical protein
VKLQNVYHIATTLLAIMANLVWFVPVTISYPLYQATSSRVHIRDEVPKTLEAGEDYAPHPSHAGSQATFIKTGKQKTGPSDIPGQNTGLWCQVESSANISGWILCVYLKRTEKTQDKKEAIGVRFFREIAGPVREAMPDPSKIANFITITGLSIMYLISKFYNIWKSRKAKAIAVQPATNSAAAAQLVAPPVSSSPVDLPLTPVKPEVPEKHAEQYLPTEKPPLMYTNRERFAAFTIVLGVVAAALFANDPKKE